MSTSGRPLLEIRDIGKTFPGVRALDGVSLEVQRGEIVALLGQNGCGKSTLVKVLSGVHEADPGGAVLVDGEPLEAAGADRARRLHVIHQDLGLIGGLTAVENLDLGRPLTGRWLRPVHMRAERRRAESLVRRYGTEVPLDVAVAELTAPQRTIIAIARALDGWDRPDNVLLLDEPTAALGGEQVGTLFAAVRAVVREGAGVIFVSHRLEEVMELADRIVVLRDGRVVLDRPRADLELSQVAHAIGGRALAERGVRRAPLPGGDVVLEARDLRAPTLDGVGLDLRAGEIVGITGLAGSGSEHLLRALFDPAAREGGRIRLAGKPTGAAGPRALLRRGMAFVPAERKRYGAVMGMSVRENLTLSELRSLSRRTGMLDGRAETAEATRWMDRFGVRPADPHRPLALLSGGNQQKVVLAKCLRTAPRVLLLDEPTQGVDVGAKASIHELIADAVTDGMAVLVASTDTKELTGLCHRVLVLRSGQVVAELPAGALSEARLVRESLGVHGADPYDLHEDEDHHA